MKTYLEIISDDALAESGEAYIRKALADPSSEHSDYKKTAQKLISVIPREDFRDTFALLGYYLEQSVESVEVSGIATMHLGGHWVRNQCQIIVCTACVTHGEVSQLLESVVEWMSNVFESEEHA